MNARFIGFGTRVNIEPYIKALRDLHTAVDLSNRVRSLQLYGAASAIYRNLLQFLEAEPPENRTSDHDYIIEKLRYFMANFSTAVMPYERDDLTLEERLKLAGDYLEKIETWT